MKQRYEVAGQKSELYYGQTFSQVLQQFHVHAPVIVFTTPQHYERFSERFVRFYSEQTVDFYILPKALYSNTITQLEEVTKFLATFSQEELVWIAFGSESVVSLVGFLSAHVPHRITLYSLHDTIQSFVSALAPVKEIMVTQHHVALRTSVLPQKIAYLALDQTKSHAMKMIDLSILILNSFSSDQVSYEALYRTYPTTTQLETVAMTSFIEPLIVNAKHHIQQLQRYGRVFEAAFYDVELSHLFSANMKRFLGIFFQLLWDLINQKHYARCDQFIQWLKVLGYPVVLPQTFNVADYLLHVRQYLQQKTTIVRLIDGRLEETCVPNPDDLEQVVLYYDKAVKGETIDE